MSKKLIAVLGLIYMICPIDLIPDVIPIIGWVDDIVVMLGAAGFILMPSGGTPAGPVVREAEVTTVSAQTVPIQSTAVVPTVAEPASAPGLGVMAALAASSAADAVAAAAKLSPEKKDALRSMIRQRVLADLRKATE